MTVLAARSISGFFGEAIQDSMRARHVEATASATRYLVALLTDYAHPDARAGETLDRPLTLLFDEAINESDPAERFQRLRTIGDGVLYGCGFFADHFEARGVHVDYLHRLGTGAYEAAGSMLRQGQGDSRFDLFAELADNFASFVKIVSDVADTTIATGAESARGLLKMYERWLKTGSDRLASALAARGVVPTRGPGGTLQ